MIRAFQVLRRWFFLFGSVASLVLAILGSVCFVLAVAGVLGFPPAANVFVGLDAFLFTIVLWMFAYTWYRIAGGDYPSMQFRWRRIPSLIALVTLALVSITAILLVVGG
jgi:hypothetical protein